MARRRINSRLTISLFPFLTVLAVVMGTLTMIICGMTLISLRDAPQLIDLVRSHHQKQPVYVECRAEGLLLHPEETPVATERIESQDGTWAERLAAIESNKDEQYVIFLVRPNGISTFRTASWMARLRDISIGYDPVHANGRITFREVN